MWDSAVHVVEWMLCDAAWRRRVRGASVLELGCGLALPGLVAHLLGARVALLTDRLANRNANPNPNPNPDPHPDPNPNTNPHPHPRQGGAACGPAAAQARAALRRRG